MGNALIIGSPKFTKDIVNYATSYCEIYDRSCFICTFINYIDGDEDIIKDKDSNITEIQVYDKYDYIPSDIMKFIEKYKDECLITYLFKPFADNWNDFVKEILDGIA